MYQVTIHNCITNSHGKKVRKVLSCKYSELFSYVDGIRRECDTKFTPNRHEEFEKLPLLCLKDSFDTGESFVYQSEKDLPTKTVLNSKKEPVLIIIPEKDVQVLGVNRFDISKLAKEK